MKQTTLKPGQLITFARHVYRVRKSDVGVACETCELTKCRINPFFTLSGCKRPTTKYKIPWDCNLVLVK